MLPLFVPVAVVRLNIVYGISCFNYSYRYGKKSNFIKKVNKQD